MASRLRAALAAASLTGAAALSGCATQVAPQWQELCTPEAVTAEIASKLRRRGDYEQAMRYLSRSCPEADLALSDIPTESISTGSARDTNNGSSIFRRGIGSPDRDTFVTPDIEITQPGPRPITPDGTGRPASPPSDVTSPATSGTSLPITSTPHDKTDTASGQPPEGSATPSAPTPNTSAGALDDTGTGNPGGNDTSSGAGSEPTQVAGTNTNTTEAEGTQTGGSEGTTSDAIKGDSPADKPAEEKSAVGQRQTTESTTAPVTTPAMPAVVLQTTPAAMTPSRARQTIPALGVPAAMTPAVVLRAMPPPETPVAMTATMATQPAPATRTLAAMAMMMQATRGPGALAAMAMVMAVQPTTAMATVRAGVTTATATAAKAQAPGRGRTPTTTRIDWSGECLCEHLPLVIQSDMKPPASTATHRPGSDGFCIRTKV